jgi:hypothetical protein
LGLETLEAAHVRATSTESQTRNNRRHAVHTLDRTALLDALSQLDGWNGGSDHIQRSLSLDEAQHAELTERVKIFADALQLRPHIRRADGLTHIRLSNPDGNLTTSEVTLAARIEVAYRAVTA